MSQEITQDILTQAVKEVIEECGRPNLAALERKLPLTREQLKRLKKNNFILTPNGNLGKHKGNTKLSGFEDAANDFLRRGFTNSQVIFDSIRKQGYKGCLTTVKNYISAHQDLVPAQRILAVETPNRGRRYETEPGEMFQMDWGFVKIADDFGGEWQCACFAMVCHHCGLRYIEFFPSARQENLFIGMVHAFSVMGVPQKVYTDNMKSVVVKRLIDGTPVWNKDYEAFQKLVGFKTSLHKVAHPWSKGQVERLMKYVKGSFIQGKTFTNITELNREALDRCHEKNSMVTRTRDLIPLEAHYKHEKLGKLPEMDAVIPYLAPLRKISYDGYVNYENRLYGVPMSFSGKTVRVQRSGEVLQILSPVTFDVLYTHQVNWSKRPKNCIGQWSLEPEEQPTQKVTSVLRFEPPKDSSKRFERFSILLEGGGNDG
ncbi:MAG: transposase family protein [Spirochaetales bacterium]|nr:transposase family protein [Candidatus Physcosoma equi]